jgi:CMP-2-keto-3-deoxyoctulosonic acid synthetase
MKKTTMETILSLIADNESAEAQTVREELTAELNRGKEKADANRKVYEEAHDIVIGVLGDIPATAQEIADAVADELPSFSRGKIVYALNHYWESEVVKDTSGKVTTYRLK